ncbi:MAG: class I SAM-dependent RNA methyltransferase [Verrucomicrobiae bacterium]|nr:class I SAM-dependent RNA methyltransferase [Verrucomicrobiae bacterium]MCP5539147.1 class I SAM-dependent RNA methyltransferase [Akkermansiaceae bacterium]MCP5549798.1 class I SAM-dependent RNA methyltransferase [Akkermansiaceae bacterium]
MPRPPRNFQPQPFAYHEEIELTIDSQSNLGHGIGRLDGWVVFVAFSLPGEKVRARVYRNAPNYSEADLVAVLEPSPDRVEPVCPLFGDCGGCQYQNFAYSAQLDWKRRQVAELLEHLAGIVFPVDPVVPSPAEFGYRSKITPHFQRPRDGRIEAIGFLKHGRRQQVTDVPRCPIASESINARLEKLRAEVRANALSFQKGATLLLRDSADGSVVTDATAVCEEVVNGVRFEFPAGEFFQNNPHILPAFTGHVAAEASAGGRMRHLVDAYCGSGLFCLTAAEHFEQAAGIEISAAAVDWARRNAENNGIANCRFVGGEAHAIFAEIENAFPPAETAVVIDPPRKGGTPEFLDQLRRFGPARVVYVSCNPATQMRDLKTLTADGLYRLTRVRPFDLFPQTRHLECVVTLEKSGA